MENLLASKMGNALTFMLIFTAMANLAHAREIDRVGLLSADAISRAVDVVDEREFDQMKMVFDLSSDKDLRSLRAAADELLSLKTKRIESGPALALKETRRLTDVALSSDPASAARRTAILAIRDLIFAFNSAFMRPLPRRTWVWSLPERTTNHGARIREAAVDVPNGLTDRGRVDPVNSKVWSRPSDLEKKDLSVGSTKSSVDTRALHCTYTGAHKGFGIHPAFWATCIDERSGKPVANGKKVKLKFGSEVHSGPFNTRVFSALGYRTVQLDYFPSLRLDYDRRLFSESNRGKEMSTFATVSGLDRIPIRLDGQQNPFDLVREAVLNDGSRISGTELPGLLLKDSKDLASRIMKRDYTLLRDEKNYDTAFESRIRSLTLNEGALRADSGKDETELGAWDYDDPVHASRRDFRGMLMIGAYLGDSDMRWDNTSLNYVHTKQGDTLRYVLSDVGTGLGRAENFANTTNGKVNDFAPAFLAPPPPLPGPHSNPPTAGEIIARRAGFRFTKFNTNLSNETFAHVTKEDAQWTARYIARLTPEQIKTALIVSGFSSAEVKKYIYLLTARRDNMVRVLGLENELGMRTAQEMIADYDPQKDGLMTAVDSRGETITAPDNGLVIRKGLVESR